MKCGCGGREREWQRKVEQAEKRAEKEITKNWQNSEPDDWDKLTRAMLLLSDMDIEVCRMSYLER